MATFLAVDMVAKWTKVTTKRLGVSNKTFLFEAGLTDKVKETRKILKPILELAMERWLLEQNMEYYVKALTGGR